MDNYAFIHRHPRISALIAGSITMLFWSSSYIFVELALPTVGPVSISAIRYFFAGLVLLPVALVQGLPGQFSRITSSQWRKIIIAGILAYPIANATIFASLIYLEVTTVSLINQFIPILVMLGGALFLREIPTPAQRIGILVSLVGSIIFFTPGRAVVNLFGLFLVGVGICAFAGFTLVARSLARDQSLPTMTLTTLPLLIGGIILIPIALGLEGVPSPSPMAWTMLTILALINTATGYALYYLSLKLLPAFEIYAVFAVSPLVTAFLAWITLEERLALIQWISLIIMIGGVMLVQLGRDQD